MPHIWLSLQILKQWPRTRSGLKSALLSPHDFMCYTIDRRGGEKFFAPTLIHANLFRESTDERSPGPSPHQTL